MRRESSYSRTILLTAARIAGSVIAAPTNGRIVIRQRESAVCRGHLGRHIGKHALLAAAEVDGFQSDRRVGACTKVAQCVSG